MRLSPRRLNRATLARQLLLARSPLDMVEAVEQIGGLQAQEPASPFLALWSRLSLSLIHISEPTRPTT